MKFLIAGGGVGGLTAAIALAREGHRIQLLEQTPEPKSVGAGISLQPNAMHALGLLGLDREVARRGHTASEARLQFSTGRKIKVIDFSPLLKRYGYLPLSIHRADLLEVLLQAATESGVEIHFGQSVRSFSIDIDRVKVTTVQQERFHGDALIGAEGIHSKVRAQLWGDQPTRYSGYVCWRGIVVDPFLAESVDGVNEIWGEGARFGFMQCGLDKVYWFATKSTRRCREICDELKPTFRGWPDPVGSILEKTPIDPIIFNEISDRKPIFPWSRGRVTLLGDAAHPMTPNFGQGGAQAIEDAIVLSMSIVANVDPELAFRSYETHRHRRTRRFVNESWQFGRIAQGGNWPARFVRRWLLALMPESKMRKQLDVQFNVQKHFNAFVAVDKS